MDQCKNCTVRGNFDECRKTPCHFRELWGFREAVEQAYKAGVMDGVRQHPKFYSAKAYFDHMHNGEIECDQY